MSELDTAKLDPGAQKTFVSKSRVFPYKTWPDKSPNKKEAEEKKMKETQETPKAAVSLSEALESISNSISYSPRTRSLQINSENNESSSSEVQPEMEDLKQLTSSDACDTKFLKKTIYEDNYLSNDNSRIVESDCGKDQSDSCIIESENDQSALFFNYTNPINQSVIYPVDQSPSSVIESDHIDQSPSSVLESDPIDQSKNERSEQIRYVPGHRKAFSLPRTLEVVNEDGSISHYPHPEIESPRSTLQRFGVVQIPIQQYNQDDNGSSISSLSSRTGFSYVDNSETSSQGDSGIQSQTGSMCSSKQPKKGLTELFSKGLSANWKLISKSGQQVAKMMRRPDHREPSTVDVIGVEGGVVSSQALIMQDRPPGLPAKLHQERDRHSQEVQAILSSVKKKEKEAAAAALRQRTERQRQEDDLAAAANYWIHTALPNWNTAREAKKTRDLWWRGLPPSVRGKVWRQALDNQLNLTPQLYSILKTRAQTQIEAWQGQPRPQAQDPAPPSSVPASPCREETLELIALDVSRTFPQLCIFQKGGPYYSHLHNVLGAYVCYRPDLGYVQGMSFIAAILILNLEEHEAFILFSNLVNRPPLSSFFNMDHQMMSGYYSTFTTMVRLHLPDIAEHLEVLKLSPDMYLLDWVMTLYGRAAPLDFACRIWDVMFRDGQDFIFKAGLGILSIFKDRILLEHDFTEVAQLLSKLPETICADALFHHIQDLNLEPKQKSFHSMFSR